MGNIQSGVAFRTPMAWVSTEQTGVRVKTVSTSSTTMGADVEEDTDDAVAKGFVNPLSVFINESLHLSLVVFVKVGAPAEEAFWVSDGIMKGLV
jgi:hypothetical protein